MTSRVFLTLAILFSLFHNCLGADKLLNFEHISIQNGLNTNSIRAISQDYLGFIWIGTREALYRYDGYSFKEFSHNQYDSQSLSSSNITCLHTSRNNDFWIGTTQGLNLYNRENNSFSHFSFSSEPGKGDDIICCLCGTPSANIWVGTNNGIVLFNSIDHSFSRYLTLRETDIDSRLSVQVTALLYASTGTVYAGIYIPKNGNKAVLKKYDEKDHVFKDLRLTDSGSDIKGIILHLHEDPDGTIWISTNQGVYHFEPEPGIISLYIGDNTEKHPILSPTAFCTQKFADNILWIGTLRGLSLFDPTTLKTHHHRQNMNNRFSISHNDIRCMYVDRTQNLWLGTLNKLNKTNPRMMAFRIFHVGDDPTENLSDNSVWTVIKDHNNGLWVGTDSGLNHYQPEKNRFEYFTSVSGFDNSLCHNIVECLLEDNKGTIWIGTLKGLNQFLPQSGQLKRYDQDERVPTEIRTKPIWALHQDKRGTIWLGSATGLYSFDPETFLFTKRHLAGARQVQLSGDIQTTCISENQRGELFFGTVNGLFTLAPGTGTITPVDIGSKDSSDKSPTMIRCLFPENNERLWIGTEFGIKILNRSTHECSDLKIEPDHPHLITAAITRDSQGQIWVTSNQELFKYYPKSERIRPYPFLPSSYGTEYNPRAIFSDNQGTIYAGTLSGLIEFNPGQIPTHTLSPKVAITNFRIFNQEIHSGTDSVLKKDITLTERIVLEPHQHSFSLTFTSLDLTFPEYNRYKYKLHPVDPEWIETDAGHRTASYSNLKPGHYTFSVLGSDCDGIWNQDERRVEITILFPFWSSWWFITLCCAILLGLLGILYKTRIIRKAAHIDSEFNMSTFCHKFKISKREQEVLELLLSGKSRREIEDLLFISEHTVKNHIYTIYKKLNIKNRTQLVNLFKYSSYLNSKQTGQFPKE